jgi:hypothetical protein
MTDSLKLLFYKLAAKGLLPGRWFEPALPSVEARAARTGHLRLEIVSHCWRYSHFLAYQLSSLALFPPSKLDVTMTVFHGREDEETVRLLEFFGAHEVPGVSWRWRPLPRERLFRRTIGRNLAALETTCDWVWFTDCDLMFRDACLDTLAARLQGQRFALAYPRVERITGLLREDDPLLRGRGGAARIVDIDGADFVEKEKTRATGPLQIAHGDVCRAVGYCNAVPFFQRPAQHWAKAHEDRIFRWLLRTPGEPLDVPGVYRIRHREKGRYGGATVATRVRQWLRQL